MEVRKSFRVIPVFNARTIKKLFRKTHKNPPPPPLFHRPLSPALAEGEKKFENSSKKVGKCL
jgi:hypothetical protein